MPIKWKTKILVFKLEDTYGVDAAPTGADGVLATNIVINPMTGEDVSRQLELAFMGGQATVPTNVGMTISFNIELVGGGQCNAGVPPAWGSILRAARVAEVLTPETEADAGDGSVEYTPISDEHESGTFHFWIGETRYVLKGCRGNCLMRVNAQGIPYLEMSFSGLFTLPSEQARINPVLSAWLGPQVATAQNTPVFTMNGQTFVMRNFSLNFGNDVQARFLVGSEGVLIVDSLDQIETQVEAVPLTTFNPYALALDPDARVAIALTHGTQAGKIVSLAVPTAQMQRPQGLAQEQNITEWPLRLIALPSDAGDDQWSLTLT